MSSNRALRAIVIFISWLCASYVGGYLLLAHFARVGYGEYDEVSGFVRVPTWGRIWDLTPFIVLIAVSMLWGYLMSRGER